MKKQISKVVSALIIVLLAAALATPAYAADFTSAADGSWSDPCTWGNCSGSIPGAGDNVVINHAVTLSADAAAAYVTIASGKSLDTAGYALTVDNLANNGTLTAGASTITVSITFTGSGIFNADTSKVLYNASGGQTVLAPLTYYDLEVAGSGNKTTLGLLTVTNNLTIGTGTIFIVGSNYAMNIGGTTSVSGTLENNAGGDKTYGNVVVNNGGVWNENASTTKTYTISGNLQNDGTFNADDIKHFFTGSDKTFSGANEIAIPKIVVNGAYTNNGVLKATSTASDALTGSGTLTQGAGSSLYISGGSSDAPSITLVASAAGNTVVYDKTSSQFLKTTLTEYHHLILKGSGQKTLPSGALTINGNFSIEGVAYAETNGNLTVQGNLSLNSTYNAAPVLRVLAHTITVNGGTTVTDGKLQHNSATGTKTYHGDFVVESGGDFDNDGINNDLTISVLFNGNLTNNGIFSSGAGTLTFNGADKTFAGTIDIKNAVIAGSYTNNGSLTVTSTLLGSGSLIQGAGAALTLQTLSVSPALTASADGNTVSYTGIGNQTVKPVTYHNLTLGGITTGTPPASNLKTTTGITVNGLLSIEGNATVSAAPAYGVDATLQYNMASTAAQPSYTTGPEWAATFNGSGGVVIKNSREIILNGNKTIAGSLEIQSTGKFRTGADAASNYNLTIGGSFSSAATATAPNFGSNLYDSRIQVAGNFTNSGRMKITSGGEILAGGDFNQSGGVFVIEDSAMQVGGNLNLASGTFTATDANQTDISLGGNFTTGATVTTTASFNLTLNGAGDQSIAGFTSTGGLTVDKPSGTATLLGNVGSSSVFSSLLITKGTLELGEGRTHYFSTWTMTGGTLEGGSAVMNLSGAAAMTGGNFTAETGTVSYMGAVAQNILGLNYYNLEVKGGATKPMTGNVTAETLTIGAGTLNTGANNLTVNGATTITGTLKHGSAINSYVYKGMVSLLTGGKWDNAINAPVNFQGGFTNTSGAELTVAAAGTGIYTFNTNNQDIAGGAAINFPSMVVTNVTLTNKNTSSLKVSNLAFTGANGHLVNQGKLVASASTIITVTGNFTNYNGVTNGTLTLNTGSTFDVAGNFDNGAGVLESFGTTGYATIEIGGDYLDAGDATNARINLTLDGAGNQNIAGLVTQTGTFKVKKTGGTATLTSNFGAITVVANRGPLEVVSGTLNLGTDLIHRFSNWVMTGGTLEGGSSAVYFSGTTAPGAATFSPQTGAIRYDGNSAQPILGLPYYNLEISRTNISTAYTKSLTGNLVVQNNFTIDQGLIFNVGAYNIEIDGATTVSGKLAHNSNLGTKTYKGMVTVTGTWDNTANAAINFQGGLTNNGTFTGGTSAVYTFSANDQTIGGSKAITMYQAAVEGIVLTNQSAIGLTVSNALSGTGSLIQDINSTLNLGGILSLPLDASANPNTVNYTGAVEQTIQPVIYHHLGLSGGKTKTITGVSTINGDLTVSTLATVVKTDIDLFIGGNFTLNGGTFTVADDDITVAGATTVKGELKHEADLGGVKTYVGEVYITGAGKWTNSGADIYLRGGLRNDSTATGPFTSGAGVYYFQLNPPAVTGEQIIGGAKPISIKNMNIASGLVLINNNTAGLTLAADGTLGGTGTLRQGSGVLNIQFTTIGDSTATLDASGAGNTVNYNLVGAQSVKDATYHNLVLAGSGNKTLPAGTTINGDFKINGTAVVILNAPLSVPGNVTLSTTTGAGKLDLGAYDLTLGGNWTRGTYGTLSATTGAVVFNGSRADIQQAINGVTIFPNLTVNNTGKGVLVKANITVNGALQLTDGIVDAPSSAIIITVGKDGTLTGGSSESFIKTASLKKFFNAVNNNQFKFALGDLNGYRPVTMFNIDISAPTNGTGFLTASIPDTLEHSAIASSGINSLQNVNRYWKFILGGSLTLKPATTYDVELGFGSAHYDLTANPATFVARKYQSTWSAPAASVYSAGDPMIVTATGFTTLGTSDFVVGELPPSIVSNVSAVNDAYGNPVDLSAKLTGGGASLAGRTIVFYFNDDYVVPGNLAASSALTNVNGVATLLDVPLPVNVGDYLYPAGDPAPASGVIAIFPGDTQFADSFSGADLRVTKRNITVTAQPVTKEFDNTTDSLVKPAITSGSLVFDDTADWSQTFQTKDIGVGKLLIVDATDVVSDGNGGANYNVTRVNASTGEITQRSLTITGGLTASSRLYDGTDVVSVSVGAVTFDGVLPAYPNVGINISNGVFEDKHVGVDKPVAAGGTLSGGDAEYYKISEQAVSGLQATIYPYSAAGCAAYNAAVDPDISCTPSQAFISSIAAVASGASRDYDGSTISTISPTCNGGSDCAPLLFPGDSVYQEFAVKDALGTNGSTLNPYINDGNGGANYGLPTANAASATISPIPLVITADNKVVYVNKTLPSYTYTVSGLLPGDSFITAPTCSSPTANIAKVNKYEIICSGGDAGGNYINPDNPAQPAKHVLGYLQVILPRTVIVKSTQAAYDGWVRGSSIYNTTGGSASNTGNLFVGDTANKQQYRSILHFDVNLPAGAVIDTATLKLKKVSITGRDPFATHGGLFINMADPYFGVTPSIVSSDFQADASLSTLAGAVGRTPDSAGWYSALLTNTAESAIPLNGLVQFRLRFATPADNDFVADYIQFYSANASSSAYYPQLVIVYYIPTE